MRVFRSALLLCAGWACAAVAPAHGQRIDSPYRFLDHSQHAGIFAGHVSADAGPIGVGPQPGPTFGARWAIRVTGPFSFGAEVAWMPTTRTVRDTVYVESESAFRALGEADMGVLTTLANLTFSLTGARTWHRLRPLLSAGAGAAFDLGSATAEEQEMPAGVRYRFGTSFAGHFGAGVEWFPADRLSLRADARNALWKLSVPEAFGFTEVGRPLPRSDWTSNLTLTAGVSIHF